MESWVHGIEVVRPGARLAGSGVVSDVTRILDRVQHGAPAAAEELLPLVYEELRNRAGHVELSP